MISSVKKFIDEGKFSKSPIDCVNNTSYTLDEIIQYCKIYYNAVPKSNKRLLSCKHKFFDSDEKCKSCGRSMADIIKEETLFDYFISKTVTRAKLLALGEILNDDRLYLKFETYLDKLKE